MTQTAKQRRAKNVADATSLRARRHAQGKCRYCERKRAKGDDLFCLAHREKHRETGRGAASRLRERRRALGLCRDCGLKRVKGDVLFCRLHREKHRAAMRRWGAKKKAQKLEAA